MAMRRPASQLNSEDLPTLGRPTMATTGEDTTHLCKSIFGLLLYQQAIVSTHARIGNRGQDQFRIARVWVRIPILTFQ